MHLEPYTPVKPEQYWCNVCDHNIVDSENPLTGHYYVQIGHAWNSKSKNYDGDYTGVMFALCYECQQK